MDTFGIKELYDIDLKATSNVEIGGRIFLPGEAILSFDELQLSILNEQKTSISARGGFQNTIQVRWENTDSVVFVCEKGITSKINMAVLSNSKLSDTLTNSVIVPKKEILESDNLGKITLTYTPLSTEFFIYDELGVAPTGYTIAGKEISNLSHYTTYLIKYLFTYTGSASILNVGQRLINGHVKLTAKMRQKDDIDGTNRTGIIEIPQARLVSDLSIRLGTSLPPPVSTFRLQGDPVGERNNRYVCQFIYLDTDIDTDNI